MSTDYLKCLGLDYFTKDEESINNFMGYLISKGRFIPLFGSDHIQLRKIIGFPEFGITIIPSSESESFDFEDCYVHCTGYCRWKVHVIKTLINETKSGKRQLMVSNKNDIGMCVMNVISPDILPSYFINEMVELQVIAFPQHIKYYKDEKEYYENEAEEFKDGKICNAVGMVMPVGFLNNHSIYNDKVLTDVDDLVAVSGKVKHIEKGIVEMFDKRHNSFIDCIIETNFGELEIVHTVNQVNKDHVKNIKVGSIVSGLFVISGDPKINQYKNGAVINKENIMRYLGTVLSENAIQPINLKRYIAENCIYNSEASGVCIWGRDNILDYIDAIKEERESEYIINAATITYADDNKEHQSGDRCLILTNPTTNEYESILFVEFNDDMEIDGIYFSQDTDYKFLLDCKKNTEIEDKKDLEDYE